MSPPNYISQHIEYQIKEYQINDQSSIWSTRVTARLRLVSEAEISNSLIAAASSIDVIEHTKKECAHHLMNELYGPFRSDLINLYDLLSAHYPPNFEAISTLTRIINNTRM